MQKSIPALNPDAYVANLDGWRLECVKKLGGIIRKASVLEEVIKWGNLVYLSNGPVLLIRTEEDRVLLCF